MSNKFIINDIKILTSWGYNLPSNKDCTICRQNLNEQSLYNNGKDIELCIHQGSCGHSFHSECIQPWVNKHKTCPICFSNWSSNVFSFNN